MIHNPHAVARLAKNTPLHEIYPRDMLQNALAPKRDKKAVLVLVPIAWSKPDRELASVVRNSIGCATPATVIPWAPGQGGLCRRLRSMHVHTDIDDQPVSHVHRFVSAGELVK